MIAGNVQRSSKAPVQGGEPPALAFLLDHLEFLYVAEAQGVDVLQSIAKGQVSILQGHRRWERRLHHQSHHHQSFIEPTSKKV
jgi:hypothetical protein